MRTLLIQPDNRQSAIGYYRSSLPEPLALECVAAGIRGDLRILDMRVCDQLTQELGTFEPDIVGVTALTQDVPEVLSVCRRVKAVWPKAWVCVGGHHATLVPSDFDNPAIDQVAHGDVAHFTPRRELTRQWRDRYTLFGEPLSTISTQRGCPYHCSFCSVHAFHGGTFYQKPVDRVLDDLATIETELVGMVDDGFFVGADRDWELATRIICSNMEHRFVVQARADVIVRQKALVEHWLGAGLYSVFIGLEGDSKTLQAVGKGSTVAQNDEAIRFLQSLGVVVWAAFIVDPQWAEEDFDRLEEYVAKMQLAPVQYTILTPLPGTRLWKDREADLLTRDYRAFDTMHAVTETRLPRERFYERFARLHAPRSVPAPLWDLVSEGRVSMDVVKKAAMVNRELAKPEAYWELDPIIGATVPC